LQPLIYYEDQQKLKSRAIKLVVGGLAAIVLGIVVHVLMRDMVEPGDFSTTAYMIVGFRGAVTAVPFVLGASGLFAGVKLISRISKPLVALISADEKGVALNLANEKQFVPWQDIRDILSKDSASISVILHNPDAFVSTASPNLAKLFKSNMKIYGSPAVVDVGCCTIPPEQIASELGQFLKGVQSGIASTPSGVDNPVPN